MKRFLLCCAMLMGLYGCNPPQTTSPVTGAPVTAKDSKLPVFTLAWSEYPSWSTFGVADMEGILKGKEGEVSALEQKWGVDIVLTEATYDACIQYYGAKTVDAACLTNMDCLSPAIGRPTTAILPTSTSFGADAVVAVDIAEVQNLKGHAVYGLEKSVSEYVFVRGLQELGENPADYKFAQMDPAAAATALQTNSPNVKAICVWNPFKMQSVETRPGAKVIFDSTKIPGEIIDMVVVGDDSLKRPGGKEFAGCVCEAYYAVCSRMNDSATRNKTLVDLGSKFSNLSAEQMAVVCKETQFYDTPAKGVEVYTSPDLPKIMDRVVGFCVEKQIVDKKPIVGYPSTNLTVESDLKFDPQYMQNLTPKVTASETDNATTLVDIDPTLTPGWVDPR